jgi:hypothetical protein
MRPKEHLLMEECVEAGVRCGLARAFKHTDDPSEDSIVDAIARAVLEMIDEKWTYDEQPRTY